MDTRIGKDIFSMVNKRAMQISHEQGLTGRGLAKGSKIQAAREIFAKFGSPGGDFESWWGEVHKHGTSVSTNPNTVRRRMKRAKQAANQSKQDSASPELVDRYISYIKEHDGRMPLDWVLLREWTDVTATDLRRARKVVIAMGYRQEAKSGGYYTFAPPLPPEPNGIPQPASTAPIQQTLTIDPDSSAAVLSDISAKLDLVISELRQLRGITSEVWK